MRLFSFIKVLTDVNIQGAAAAQRGNISVCYRKDTSRAESSINMKIFISIKARISKPSMPNLPGLTMLDFSFRLPR